MRGIPLTLADGKERHLWFTLGSMRRLKGKGIDFLQLTEQQVSDHIAEILWSGLAWEDPTLTPDSVADLVDITELESVTGAFASAFADFRATEVPAPDPLTMTGQASPSPSATSSDSATASSA